MRKSKKILAALVLVLSFIVFSLANSQSTTRDSQIPKPKSRPWGSSVNEDFNKTIKNLGLEKLLSNINDPRIKQAVVDAAKGKCPNSSNVQGAADVQHKKQCEPKGRPPKVPNGKDGKKCIVPNLKGGSIEGMCIQGCCVYISSSAKGASEKYLGGSNQGGYGYPGQGFGTPQEVGGLFKSFMNLLKGFGSDSGGSDSGNYGNYYNYDYENFNNINDDTDYDSLNLNTFDYSNDDYELEDITNVENTSTVKNQESGAVDEQTSSENSTSDSVDSIIYGSDAAKDQEYADDERYGFVRTNKGKSKAGVDSNSSSSKEEIIEIEKKSLKDIGLPSKGASQDNKELEYTVTGFDKSIKVSNAENLSFWERLKLFFLSIFR